MLNWDAIGAVGEIAGALAVVISVLYLASQIRTGNRVAIRETTVGLNSLTYADSKLALENPLVASLLVKLRNPQSDLSEQEKMQAEWYCYVRINHWAAAQSSLDSGLLQQSKTLEQGYRGAISMTVAKYPLLRPFMIDALDGLKIKPGLGGRLFDHLWSELEDAGAGQHVPDSAVPDSGTAS